MSWTRRLYKTPRAHHRYDLLIQNRQRVKYDCTLHMQTKRRWITGHCLCSFMFWLLKNNRHWADSQKFPRWVNPLWPWHYFSIDKPLEQQLRCMRWCFRMSEHQMRLTTRMHISNENNKTTGHVDKMWFNTSSPIKTIQFWHIRIEVSWRIRTAHAPTKESHIILITLLT